MLADHPKLIVSVSLAILLCIFGCIGIAKLAQKGSEGQLPIQTLVIAIDLSQRDEFFVQMQKFADKHAIKILIRDVEVNEGPSGKGFFIEMHRSDIQILAVGEPSAPIMVSIDFYDEDSAHPASEETMDSLFNSLKRFINEIPNALITEKRKGLTITIDEDQREELFARMQQLADKHALKFELTLSSDKTLFKAEIYGDGFHIKSDPLVGSPRSVVINFYVDYHKVPTSTSLETVDELYNELKNLLGEIPNVTITEEK